MPVSEVTALRNSGRLDEAYQMALTDLELEQNDWTRRSLFWCIYALCKNRFLSEGDKDTAREMLGKLEQLKDAMEAPDEVCERSCQSLRRKLLPHADVLQTCDAISKEEPAKAFQQLAQEVPNGEVLLPEQHEQYGWILYRYLRSVGEDLQPKRVRELLADYMNLANPRPSLLHSRVLHFAQNYAKSHSELNFFCFFKLWNIENLQEDDWQEQKSKDGEKTFPALAQTAILRAANVLLNVPSKREEDLQLLGSWIDQCSDHGIHDEWLLRARAKVDLLLNEPEQAIQRYRKLLTTKENAAFIWQELAHCVAENGLRIGLLLKAKSLQPDEQFLGKIHLNLAEAWLAEGFPGEALAELNALSKTYTEKGWHVPGQHDALRHALPSGTQEESDAERHAKYLEMAEEFAYAEFPWEDFIVVDRFKQKNKVFCVMTSASGEVRKLKVPRNSKLRQCNFGTVVSMKFSQCNRPLVCRVLDRVDWSSIPLKFGVVDYLNQEKQVMHIVTPESDMLFCKLRKGLKVKGLVQYREYVQNGEKHAANVSPAEEQQAIGLFPHDLFVVDDVNQTKQLFHAVTAQAKKGLVVHFDETNLRPSVGTCLSITCYNRKMKDGSRRSCLLTAEVTSETLPGMLKEVDGNLSLKYDDYGSVKCGFIHDAYVHPNLLREKNITSDQPVHAKMVYTGNGKWKVYELSVEE